MKDIIAQLNKAFENRVRLGIMSVLMVNQDVDFTGLRTILDVTDGNLASHLRALEEAGYIISSKKFIDRKPNTTYSVTDGGSEAFRQHLKTLENLINQ
jgi:DNA-binding MarR family transcriptional regulator